ncbi:MAG: lysophospholipid acyltransferase family protein [Negativicutes bacterium]|jgi:1-acyl-sn-glycerol-3-phosphate acyltransferase
MLIYWVCRIFVLLIAKTLFRMKVFGAKNLPQGQMIIAANHVHVADPFIVGIATPVRVKISYMGKSEIFKNRLVAALLRQWRVFPVERSVASSAAASLRYAIGFINSGFSLGIFPEGTRSKDGMLGKATLGAAMIAMRAKVPIVPTAVFGTKSMLKTGVTVVFGVPLYPNDYENNREGMQKMTDDMMKQIAKMLAVGVKK